MDSKFHLKNEVEKEMGVIEEETSDEDNSSKDGSGSNKAPKPSLDVAQKDKVINQGACETGELCEINSKSGSTPGVKKVLKQSNTPRLMAEKRHKNHSIIEEEKVSRKLNSSSFYDIRDSYDYIRQHRSSSCKSAAASLQFSKRRYLTKKIPNSPFIPYSKRSNHLSTSTTKCRTHMPSILGLGNRKMSEPSLVDTNRRVESNSKCLSDASWNITHINSDTKNSMPLKR